MINQICLTGNLGADPEIFYNADGEPIASFNLAFHASRKKTGWIKVTAFKKLAEVTEKYLHKGARVAIIGTMDQHTWKAEDGSSRSAIQAIANVIEFIKTDGRGFEQGQEQSDIPI